MFVELAALEPAGAAGLRSITRAGEIGRRSRISVGIINNMPDAALQPTERQFVTLLQASAEQFDLRIHLLSLPGIVRIDNARERVKARYLDFDCLRELHMDALIVTGAVPNALSLAEEPFWPHMTELADWASTHTVSVLWSCLSAHAVALYLDGIERRRLPKKLSGLYRAQTCGTDPLLAGIEPAIWVPHSRYNDLPEQALRAAGYTILCRSDGAGVDIFHKSTPSWFVFLQGHPEYDSDTLLREYRRDVLQYLAHERTEYPNLPSNYFNPATEEILNVFARKARFHRNPGLAEQFPNLRETIPHIGVWQPAATRLFSNWINHVAILKTRQLNRQGAAA